MGAFENPLLSIGLETAADLSNKQFFAVKYNGSGKLAVCSVAGERWDGILQDQPGEQLATPTGATGAVMLAGITKASAGGTFSEGDLLTTDSAGELVEAAGGHFVKAKALADAVDGDIVPVELIPGGFILPRVTFAFPMDLADIADGDIVTGFVPGFKGKIEALEFITGTPATTASKLSTLNAEIGTTNITGGTVALTTAACDTLGKRVAGAAVTAANEFDADDAISIEASSTTAFIEGDGTLYVHCAMFPI